VVDKYLLPTLSGEPLREQLKTISQDELVDVAEYYINQWASIQYAAHMPSGYQYGLPSWINQVLYACYVGAFISPDIDKIIEGTVKVRVARAFTDGIGHYDLIEKLFLRMSANMSDVQQIELLEEFLNFIRIKKDAIKYAGEQSSEPKGP